MSTAFHDLPSAKNIDRSPRSSAARSREPLALKKTLVMSAASLVALAISVYLAFAAYTMSEVAGCGGGGVFDCGHVLHSRWSKALGIPVSVFAIATHVAFLSSLWISWRGGARAKAANLVAMLTALTAAVAAIYFIALQVFVLQHLCSYCMTAHAGGLLIGAMTLTSLPIAGRRIAQLSTVALAGVSALAVIQMTSAEPVRFEIQTYQPTVPTIDGSDPANQEADQLFSAPTENVSSGDASSIFAAPVGDQQTRAFSTVPFRLLNQVRRPQHLCFASTTALLMPRPAMTQAAKTSPAGKLVPINGGTIKLKSSDWPLLGKPNAKHIFVEMFDYTCKHCRSTNKAIEAAKETMGDDLAIISLPVPMNKDCNTTVQTTNAAHTDACRLARLAIAVWRVERSAFPPFHQWLFSSDVAPSYDSALAEANQRVDPAKLATELGNTLCDQYLSRNVELYKRAGEGAIPKLIFKQTTIVGEFTSGSSLADLIRQYTAK